MKKLAFWHWHWGALRIVNRYDEGLMTPKEKFKYFLVAALIMMIIMELAVYGSAQGVSVYNTYDWLISLLSIVATLLGSLYLFLKHTQATSFIEKYTVVFVACLPVVIFLVLIPVSVLGYLLVGLAGFEIGTDSTWFDLVIMVLAVVAVYWKIGTYFK